MRRSKSRYRITIMLDKEVRSMLAEKQASKISKTSRAVSFSDVVNEYLKKGLAR